MIADQDSSASAGKEPSTLAELLRCRAKEKGQGGYTFLVDGSTEGDNLDFAELDRRARVIAATLSGTTSRRGNILIFFPQGLEFIQAFFGCIYGGFTPVPAYWPQSSRHFDRTKAIFLTSDPVAVLATEEIRASAARHFSSEPALASVQWLLWEYMDFNADVAAPAVDVAPDDLALVQYTSGSTTDPRGVALTHRNVLANQRMIRAAFRHSRDTVVAGWLPFYHDMGLIGNILQPLYVGGRAILMNPQHFLVRPANWLNAITKYRATTAGAPNFAYDLCTERITASERKELDLTSWQVAYNGAEVVRASTLDRFVEAFGSVGFRHRAFLPCYGLAEATLLVTARNQDCPLVVRGETVSCGQIAKDLELKIVDPKTNELRSEREIGEIWLRGPSVAQSYWNNPTASEKAFGARLKKVEGSFLRTGDLGFISEDQLFVTGRVKDILIIRGRNLAPQDLEWTVATLDPSYRTRRAAAISISIEDREELVLLQECPKGANNFPDFAKRIFDEVVAQHQVEPRVICFVREGGLPVTTSGKIRRAVCREKFLAGSLRVLFRWQKEETARPSEETEGLQSDPELWLRREVGRFTHQKAAEIGPDLSLISQGLDSVKLLELIQRYEDHFGFTVVLNDVLSRPTLKTLLLSGRKTISSASVAVAAAVDRHPLSRNQQALLFLCEERPESTAYHLSFAFHVQGVSSTVLVGALQCITKRHPALRTKLSYNSDDATFYSIVEESGASVEVVDASDWSEEMLLRELRRAAWAPFELRGGSLWRACVYNRPNGEAIVSVAVHHIIADFWSLKLILQEIRSSVAQMIDSTPQTMESYGRHVLQEESFLGSVAGDAARKFWREILPASLPILDLSFARPERAQQKPGANVVTELIPSDVVERLRRVAHLAGASIYTVLLAGWCAVLHRFANQREILVGTPAWGRTHGWEHEVCGYFVNLLPIASTFEPDQPFLDLVQRLARTVRGAIEHQRYPFATLVRELNLARTSHLSPLCQAHFVFQSASSDPFAALWAMNRGGLRENWQTAQVETIGLGCNDPQVELALHAAESTDEIHLQLMFSQYAVSEEAAKRLLLGLRLYLEEASRVPDSAVSLLPLIPQESCDTVRLWNSTQRDFGAAGARSLPELIEDQMRRTPDAVAVSLGESSLSYRALDILSAHIAGRIIENNIGPDSIVGLYMDRDLLFLPAILGILRAGAAYLPIDIAYPIERARHVVADSRCELVLTLAKHVGELSALSGVRIVAIDEIHTSDPVRFQRQSILGESLAYVIYTSGSTGGPKGVMSHHRGIVNRLLWMQQLLQLTPPDSIFQKTTTSFDVSVWELFLPLITGARLVLAQPRKQADASYLVREIVQQGVTVIHFVPSMLQPFLQEHEAACCRSLRFVICSGEALLPEHVESFYSRFNTAVLYNFYGPTEASVDVTWWRCSPGTQPISIPIGKPITNTGTYILDESRQLCPIGVTGELHLASVGLARGYLHRPGLTAEKFGPSPFCHQQGDRLYSTGDLAVWMGSGDVRYIARIDHQVKWRGFRVELGEIETALRRHPDVYETAVLLAAQLKAGESLVDYNRIASTSQSITSHRKLLKLRPGECASHEQSGLQLVAYYSTHTDAPISRDLLKRFLETSLPSYMVPAAFIHLEVWPLNHSGKLDRAALAKIDYHAESTAERIQPRTPVEAKLLQIWREVLGARELGVEQNFFEAGGDSIRALQVRAKSAEAGIKFALEDLMQWPTVEKLAERAIHVAEPVPYKKISPFELISAADRARMGPGVEDAFPLARVQAGLIYHAQLAPDSMMYQDTFVYTFNTRFAEGHFRQALQGVTRRHPNLRTAIDLGNFSEPLQIVYADVHPILRVERFEGLDSEGRDVAASKVTSEEKVRAFHLSQAPLIRFTALVLGPESFELLITFHDSIFDGWSKASLLTEILKRYDGLLVSKPVPHEGPPAVGYQDFVALERCTIRSEGCRAYWSRLLEGSNSGAIPRWPRRARQQGEAKIILFDVPISAETSEGLIKLARVAGAPLKSVLLAVHVKVMSLVTGQRDVLTGMEINGRVEELEGDLTLGIHINTVPFRVKLTEGSWVQLARNVFGAERELFPHRRFPLAEIQRRNEKRVFDGVFNYTHFHVYEQIRDLKSVRVSDAKFFGQSHFPLRAEFNRDPFLGRVQLDLECDADEIGQAQLEDLGRLYAEGLSAAAATPLRSHDDEFPSVPERVRVGPYLHPYRMFIEAARRGPDHIALIGPAGMTSYAALEQYVKCTAEKLRTNWSISTEHRVGVLCPKDERAVVSVLAILAAGGAYVPLSAHYPRERIAEIIADARLSVILAAEELTGLVADFQVPVCSVHLENRSQTELACSLSPEALVYVIYTSGSTGKPKGVAVSAANLSASLESRHSYYKDVQERFLWTPPLIFDSSVAVLFGTLTSGGSLIMPDASRERDSIYLTNLIRKEAVSAWLGVPALYGVFLDTPELLGSLTKVIVAGEALSPELLARHCQLLPACRFFNEYGPTEGTVWATVHCFDGKEEPGLPPIGRSIPDHTVEIVGEAGDHLPPYAPGELWLGGPGIARGYLNKPRLTAERFLPSNHKDAPVGARVYCSGDIGCRLRDGTLRYLGRRDAQVKINGHRIELEEIQSILSEHPQAREVLVKPAEHNGRARLIAFVTRNRSIGIPRAARLQLERARISEWSTAFESIYHPESERSRDEMVGWTDSATGKAIHRDAMDRWLDESVRRITSFHPKRVLEIGCGTGALIGKIAPKVDAYWGTEISSSVLDQLRSRLTDGGHFNNVRLSCQPAHSFEGLTGERVDTIILNSVIQYFPSREYLIDVLSQCEKLLAGDGRIYLGDLRNLHLARTFYIDVEQRRAGGVMSIDKLKRAVARRERQENELLISPAFLIELKRILPRLTGVSLMPKTSPDRNELNLFRFDAVLWFGSLPKLSATSVWPWHEGMAESSLAKRLLSEPDQCIRVTRIPLPELHKLESLYCDRNAAKCDAYITSDSTTALSPHAVVTLAHRVGRSVSISLADDSLYFDALFLKSGNSHAGEIILPATEFSPVNGEDVTSEPLARELDAWLAAELQRLVVSRLPEYSRPSEIRVMRAFPRLASGKVDVNQLLDDSVPERKRPRLAEVLDRIERMNEQEVGRMLHVVRRGEVAAALS